MAMLSAWRFNTLQRADEVPAKLEELGRGRT
jgi:hypothetical protein